MAADKGGRLFGLRERDEVEKAFPSAAMPLRVVHFRREEDDDGAGDGRRTARRSPCERDERPSVTLVSGAARLVCERAKRFMPGKLLVP